ncbi:MAG: tRNA 2-thiocytidine(32) synthetase TtcA [Bacteroidales bacterium]|nr:tRNA 2-thiocytidine(32) synthetase TtcA [Bacteroidales bacterium]
MDREKDNANKKSLKYIDNINRKVGRTIYKQKLIEENDRILIGLSGGKDSLVLLEALANRKKYLPFKFELIATHINVKNVTYEIDNNYLKNLCDKLNTPIHFRDIAIDLNQDPKKSTCFICSWQKRKELFLLTKELNCNKLALGHHLNDANETLLMNMIYHGSISSLPYKLQMFKGRIHLIRPLLDIHEEKIEKYAQIRQYPDELKICAYGEKTKRQQIKEILKKIEKIHRKSTINIFRSHHKIYKEYLPEIENN